jgi:carboxymethylenebutenolidase
MVSRASAVQTLDVKCSNGMPAFVAYPTSNGPCPVYVLLHERYGLVEHTKDLALRCARDGFFVVAPNLFFRHADQAQLSAGNSRYDLSDDESIVSLRAVLEELKNCPEADAERVAVGGYCQTGRFPLVFAAHVPIQAAIVWYGAASKREWGVNERQPQPLEKVIAQLPCPVFGAFGSDDHIISVSDIQRFRGALEATNKSYDLNIYRGAPHGWLNDTMPGRYRREQAEAAWSDQQRFLQAVLDRKAGQDSVSWKFTSAIASDYNFEKNVRLE